MTLLTAARKALRNGRNLILAKAPDENPGEHQAWADAVSLWNDLFAPFSPLVEDADVLELGCGDGRLLGAMVASGKARSGTGLEHHAYWEGIGGGAPWRPSSIRNLEMRTGEDQIDALDDEIVDLIIAREFDGFLPLDKLEERLSRLFSVLRPGGEVLLRTRCGNGSGEGSAPGYGFLTPTSWIALFLAAGFEVVDVRRVWRTPADQGPAAARLPDASDEERLAEEIRLHLVRPWESWELDALREFGDQRRRRKKAE